VGDSSGIVRSGPQADIPHGEPVSDIRLPQLVSTVAADPGEQGGTQQGRVRTPIVWRQGIPLRQTMAIHCPSNLIPSRASPADLASRVIIGVDPSVNASSALAAVIDAIDPASCHAVTRSYSGRAEADEADISKMRRQLS